jgi:hypothetical protein
MQTKRYLYEICGSQGCEAADVVVTLCGFIGRYPEDGGSDVLGFGAVQTRR